MFLVSLSPILTLCMCACVCAEDARSLSTLSEKPDASSPSPQSERRSWSSSPSHSLQNTHSKMPRKQPIDQLRRPSTASGKRKHDLLSVQKIACYALHIVLLRYQTSRTGACSEYLCFIMWSVKIELKIGTACILRPPHPSSFLPWFKSIE